MKNFVSRFAKDESGATAIEYGLIAGLMGVILIAAFAILGPQFTTAFTNIGTRMQVP